VQYYQFFISIAKGFDYALVIAQEVLRGEVKGIHHYDYQLLLR
jgi:hypothetical protein